MDAMGSMRDLDQIREQDDAGSSSRLMSLALGGMATACVLFAIGVVVGREAGESRTVSREDPLARLDQLARPPETAATPITYPERRTRQAPGTDAAAGPAPGAAATSSGAGTTAPSANNGTTVPPAVPPVALTTPVAPAVGAPGAGDRPVLVPSSPLTASMGSGIRLSNTVGNEAGALGAPSAPGAAQSPATPGAEGPFSVQVSSFRSQTGAQAFAQRLRERGYHAFVTAPATAPNGVVWHRVRIGPFATQREATTYRAQFENRERMPTIVVRRDAPGNERD